MKAADADILIVPGYKNSGPNHWQSKWESRIKSARRVTQKEWSKPVLEDWTTRMADEVNACTKPIIIIAHSLGVAAAIQAIPHYQKPIRGAFLVAPPDVANPNIRPKHLMTFGPYPRDPLPFPSILIASRNDEFSSFEAAEDIAGAWGSMFIDAGERGHIDDAAGHGPWPEGSLTFAKFMQTL